MIFRALILLFTLSYSLSAASRNYWKHSEQQGEVGSCHSFATIALIEAEYKKTHGQYLNLSERDLFIRHFTQGYRSPADCVTQQLTLAALKPLPEHYREIGHVSDDFKLAQQHGIASERELPYTPTFSKGVSISLSLLRKQRELATHQAEQLRSSKLWNSKTQLALIQQHSKKLTNIHKTLSLPANTKTRQRTKAFLQHYQLIKITPRTTPSAKADLIRLCKSGPVAIDISNLSEFSPGYSNHSRHSLIVSHHLPETDEFSIRSSTFKGEKKVAADIIARGCYQIYFLKPKAPLSPQAK